MPYVKRNQGLNDAAEQQPWRCAKCGTAVRKGMNDPCACIHYVIVQEMREGATWQSDPHTAATMHEVKQCIRAGWLAGEPRRAVGLNGRVLFALDAKGNVIGPGGL